MNHPLTEMLSAMSSRPEGKDGRISRDIYIINKDTFRIEVYTGWDCAPQNPDHYWCPNYGYTVYAGNDATNAFLTIEAARFALVMLLDETKKKIDHGYMALYFDPQRKG